MSGHKDVEWPGIRADRRASSGWLGTDFPVGLLHLQIFLFEAKASLAQDSIRQFSLYNKKAPNSTAPSRYTYEMST